YVIERLNHHGNHHWKRHAEDEFFYWSSSHFIFFHLTSSCFSFDLYKKEPCILRREAAPVIVLYARFILRSMIGGTNAANYFNNQTNQPLLSYFFLILPI